MATVTAVRGSVPRGAGAKMVVWTAGLTGDAAEEEGMTCAAALRKYLQKPADFEHKNGGIFGY